jgi:hypothetical protein
MQLFPFTSRAFGCMFLALNLLLMNLWPGHPQAIRLLGYLLFLRTLLTEV